MSCIVDVSKWLQQAAHTEGEYVPGEHKSIDKQPDLVDLTTSKTRNAYPVTHTSSHFPFLLFSLSLPLLSSRSGLRKQTLSASQSSLRGADSDTASMRSDVISLNSYQSEQMPTMCKALYSYEVQ